MNILILGASGFIGQNLTRFLLKKNDTYLTLASSNVENVSWLVKKLPKTRVTIQKCDLLDEKEVREIVQGQDVIINLVGYSGVINSIRHPEKTIQINTIGHLHLLEACRNLNPTAKILIASSRLEYGKAEKLPISIKHPAHPHTVYGVSKYAATKFSLMYHKLYKLPVIIFRISNPFGPQTIPTHRSYNLVNHFIDQAMKDSHLTLFGTGEQKRDYIYVEDLCEAIWQGITNDKAIGKIFNIGSGTATSLKDMLELIINEVGTGSLQHKAWPAEWNEVETGDHYFDIGYTKKILAWQPQHSLKKGIRLTVSLLQQSHESR